MNPFPQFLFVAQSTANLKPEEACVRIHKSRRKIPLRPHAAKGRMARSRNIIGTARPIAGLPVRLVAIAFAFCLRILPYFAAFCRGKSFISFVCNSIRGLIIRRSQVRVLPPPPITSACYLLSCFAHPILPVNCRQFRCSMYANLVRSWGPTVSARTVP